MIPDDPYHHRRNLILTSLAFLLYFLAGGHIYGEEAQIRLSIVNVGISRPWVLGVFAHLALFWFAFRYWQDSEPIKVKIKSDLSSAVYRHYAKIKRPGKQVIGPQPSRITSLFFTGTQIKKAPLVEMREHSGGARSTSSTDVSAIPGNVFWHGIGVRKELFLHGESIAGQLVVWLIFWFAFTVTIIHWGQEIFC